MRRAEGRIDASGDRATMRRPTWVLAAPFAVVALLALATLLAPPYADSWWAAGLAVLTGILVGVAGTLSLRLRDKPWLNALTAYLMFPYAAFLHHAAGGSSSGMTVLVLLPILWLALTGTRRELWIAGALALATFVVPVLLIGEPTYSLGDWRRAVVWAAVALVIAPVIQRIVSDLGRETALTQLANARVERLFEDAPHGVALLDPGGRIVRVNTAMAVMVGMEPDEMRGHGFQEYESPDEEALPGHLGRVLDNRDDVLQTACNLRDSGGNDVNVELSSTVVHDPSMGDIVMVNVVDISDRRNYLDRLAHLADHDALTGLANRKRFDRDLQRHLERCRRYGPVGALLLLDLDHFKQVNDTLGHNHGDQLLISVAGLLRRAIRSTDIVARLGGDEFAILLTDGGEEEASQVADLIVDRVRDHAATLDGVRRRVTASVGAVTFRAAAEHAADVLALADMTMYDAKEAGRNQAAVLPEGDARGPRSSARLLWQSRIEEALETDRFELHLQPIMDLSDDRIGAAEVLLRLREKDELVPPARFIYIAERTGLMPRVDAWVIAHSVEMLARIRLLDPDFRLEVNLSGHSIGNPEIEATIVDSLRRYGVPPSSLILEITETAAVADVGLARAFAERMTDLGCRFALDDFGAGFGSFYYLKHLLFDFVKIDGEFVAHSNLSAIDRTIMRSIVGIARDLGKQTVAEFVSDPEVLEVVRAEGVDQAQGFHIGRPVPYDDFVAAFLPCAPVASGTVA